MTTVVVVGGDPIAPAKRAPTTRQHILVLSHQAADPPNEPMPDDAKAWLRDKGRADLNYVTAYAVFECDGEYELHLSIVLCDDAGRLVLDQARRSELVIVPRVAALGSDPKIPRYFEQFRATRTTWYED